MILLDKVGCRCEGGISADPLLAHADRICYLDVACWRGREVVSRRRMLPLSQLTDQFACFTRPPTRTIPSAKPIVVFVRAEQNRADSVPPSQITYIITALAQKRKTARGQVRPSDTAAIRFRSDPATTKYCWTLFPFGCAACGLEITITWSHG